MPSKNKIFLTVLIPVSLFMLLWGSFTEAISSFNFGLKEGELISVVDDPDVYVVNDRGYKRLFINPVIFEMYGHLGGWKNVLTIPSVVRDALPTSPYFRNCEANSPKVYAIEVTGKDDGLLHWVDISAKQALSSDPDFFKKVFCINNEEFSWYAKGQPYTSAPEVPQDSRESEETATAESSDAESSDKLPQILVWAEQYDIKFLALKRLSMDEFLKISLEDIRDFNNFYDAVTLLPLQLIELMRYDVIYIIDPDLTSISCLESVFTATGLDTPQGNISPLIPEEIFEPRPPIILLTSTPFGSEFGGPVEGESEQEIYVYPPRMFLCNPIRLWYVIHEIGHIVDYNGIRLHKGVEFTLGKTLEESKKLYREYESIFTVPEEIRNSDIVPSGFLSTYATKNVVENFADHFAFYVLDGESFREKSGNDALLSLKYNFFKEKIFSGKEYLIYPNFTFYE